MTLDKFHLNNETKEWYKNIVNDLRNFYSRTGVSLTDRELFIAIERQFGNRILEEICIPHNLNAGSCILAAMLIAKEAA